MPLCKPHPPQGVRGVDRGTHYVLCGGRIIIGPDYKSLALSTALILVPSVIFFIFVVPYMGSHMSWAFIPVSVVLVVFVFTMLAMTAFRDPGFYPRSPPNSDVEFGLAPSTREYHLNGYTVTTKYCSTCCHYRPPRCSHCAQCDNCVDKFDHHCPWVGNCIGRRNYRTFFLFIFSTAVLCLFVLATCILQLWDAAGDRNGSWSEAISSYPASLILSIYVFLCAWFVGGLSAFHSWLIARNSTTYEHFRHRHSDAGNPYSHGILGNCAEVLCWPTPPRFSALWDKQRQEDDAAGTTGPVLQFSPMDGSVPPSVEGGDSSIDGSYHAGKRDIGHLENGAESVSSVQGSVVEMTAGGAFGGGGNGSPAWSNGNGARMGAGEASPPPTGSVAAAAIGAGGGAMIENGVDDIDLGLQSPRRDGALH